MKIRRSMLKDTVIVATRTGEGAYGPTYDDRVRAVCNIDETRRMVRDADGDEAVSEATLTLHPSTQIHPVDGDGVVVGDVQYVDPLQVFIPESTVYINGRASRVLSAKALTLRGYVTSVEVTCA